MPIVISKEPSKLRDTLKPGIILFSSVTDIFYKMEKGTLMRFSAYGGGERRWVESSYAGPKKACMKAATAKELKRLL